MANKAYVGFWIDEDVRKKMKVACVLHNTTQGDVMQILLTKWLNKPHIKDEFKILTDGTGKEK